MSEQSRHGEQNHPVSPQEVGQDEQTTHHEQQTSLGGLRKMLDRLKSRGENSEQQQDQSASNDNEATKRPTSLKDEWVIRRNGNRLAKNARPAAFDDNLHRIYSFRDPDHPKQEFPPDSQPSVGNNAVRRSVDEALRRKGLLTDQPPQETAPMVEIGSSRFKEVVGDRDLSIFEKHRIKRAVKSHKRNQEKVSSRIKKVGADRIAGFEQKSQPPQTSSTEGLDENTRVITPEPRSDVNSENQKKLEHEREQARLKRVRELAKFMNGNEDATDDVIGLINVAARKGSIGVIDLQRQLSHGKNRPTLAQVLPKAEILKNAGVIDSQSENGYWRSLITDDDFNEALDLIANGQVDPFDNEAADNEGRSKVAYNKTGSEGKTKAQDAPESNTRLTEPEQSVVKGEVVPEQTTPQPEEEIYDIEIVEDTPKDSSPATETDESVPESIDTNQTSEAAPESGSSLPQEFLDSVNQAIEQKITARANEEFITKDRYAELERSIAEQMVRETYGPGLESANLGEDEINQLIELAVKDILDQRRSSSS